MKNWKFILIGMFVPILAACGASGQNTAQVTALPTSEEVAVQPTATPTLSPTDAATDEATEAPEETEEVEVAAVSASPTPSSRGLAPGESRAIALATDMVMKPEVDNPLEFSSFPVRMSFDDFYSGYSMRSGFVFSDKLLSLDGQQVVIEGYMAPPLKPALDWFVLTRVPLALCPFCSTDADWPSDIALVYMSDGETTLATDRPLRVIGTLEVGSSTDADTGMVSVVRVYADRFETINP